ncbi:hypothetical protein [[Clostridium] symbiosum]|uniref:hypothetical protein n=1 Tax=Clostridium symbiosum TaxID=1512 RepID=UPI001AA10FA3|nr:hypothetical protein [[Clostridium] symbiosum]MBO1695211.1 hypothetical protein [[Clostridium] symbiosum]
MTVEEQKYLEECRKKLGPEQAQVIQMAFEYGLGIKEVRKVAIPKLSAEQMRQTVFAVLEGVENELIDLCCQGDLDQYQIPEIVSGHVSGLTLDEIKSYAAPNLPASRMKKMRTQLIEAKKNASETAEGAAYKTYTENLIKLMETSLQQFKQNNEKFEVLSALVKEHVLDEKNQEIKDLYENVKSKDSLIHKLQEEANERETVIRRLTEEMEALKNTPAQHEITPNAEVSPPPASVPPIAPVQPVLERRSLLEKLFPKKAPDILDKIGGQELSSEQLEEIRQGFEAGLSDEEVLRITRRELTADKMKKMREIMLLVRERRQSNG